MDTVALYKAGVLDSRILNKLGIKITYLEVQLLRQQYLEEYEIHWTPNYPLYDKYENGQFTKILKLSNETEYHVTSKTDIGKRLNKVLKAHGWRSFKEHRAAKILGLPTTIYTINY